MYCCGFLRNPSPLSGYMVCVWPLKRNFSLKTSLRIKKFCAIISNLQPKKFLPTHSYLNSRTLINIFMSLKSNYKYCYEKHRILRDSNQWPSSLRENGSTGPPWSSREPRIKETWSVLQALPIRGLFIRGFLYAVCFSCLNLDLLRNTFPKNLVQK